MMVPRVIVRTMPLLASIMFAPSTTAESLSDEFERAVGSVVVVRAISSEISTDGSGASEAESTGSGVLIDVDGSILTAEHVVAAASDLSVEYSNGERSAARIVRLAPGGDVALLRAAHVPGGVSVAKLADSDKARIGDELLVIGAPFGYSKTLTVGHLSGRVQLGRTMGPTFDQIEFLQTDASINEGNSGGPVFDRKGNVLGIVSYFISKEGAPVGLGFAVASNTAQHLLDHETPYFGIDGMRLDDRLRSILNVSRPGILVQRVAAGSLASQMGIKGGTVRAMLDGRNLILGGDVIVEVQGIPVGPDLKELLRQRNSWDPLSVTVIRSGETVRLDSGRK